MSDDLSYQEAARLSLQQSQANQQNDPKKICQSFKVRLISFINDIERLLRKEELLRDVSFLDKVAEDVVALNNMSTCTTCCSESIQETGQIIHNVLNEPLSIKSIPKNMTTLQVAKKYREDPSFLVSFSNVLLAYRVEKEQTTRLMSQLKILAFDLTD